MSGHPSTEDQVLSSYFERLLVGGADLVSASVATPQGEFQVQGFRLGKLGFAVPVAQLSGVFALEAEIASWPGQPTWALGQVSVAGRKVWAVNPAGLILPGLSISGPYPWALLPRGGELALLCHEVEEPCRWRPEEVRWRTERISRPWLLGMQGDPPCPLIDVERLVQDLKP